MKISQKLALGFIGVALLVWIVSIFVIFQNNKIKTTTEKEVFNSITQLDDVWAMMEAQEHQEIAAKDHLLLGKNLKEKRADYFYEKERWQKVYQRYLSICCKHVKPWLRRYNDNIKAYHTKIEEAFALDEQGADLEIIKAKIEKADKYVTIAHEEVLEPIIEHVHNVHIEPGKKALAKRINQTSHIAVIISFVAVFFAAVLGFFISRNILLPIKKLKVATTKIGEGDLDTKIEINSNDEIAELACSFNAMAEDLKNTTTSIDKLEKEIAERKKVENELKAVNCELKDFVYIASHDLREPLGKITSFGGLLKDSLEGKLEDDDKENLDFMVDGANRMTQMIEGLLTYSRLNTKQALFETVDLNEIVRQLQRLELAELLEETNAVIEVPQSLPEVKANPVQIRQLLQNLIANGIKYRRKETSPKIVVTAEQLGNDKTRIEIQDNGIGIKKEFQEDVFKMFKRLHSRREYEGAGIGLAVCKKIVEKHDGQIGVVSKPKEGSTFFFTLSAANEPVAVS